MDFALFEGYDPGPWIFNEPGDKPVEIRPVGSKKIIIPFKHIELALLELDKLERPRADWFFIGRVPADSPSITVNMFGENRQERRRKAH